MFHFDGLRVFPRSQLRLAYVKLKLECISLQHPSVYCQDEIVKQQFRLMGLQQNLLQKGEAEGKQETILKGKHFSSAAQQTTEK